MPNLTLLDPQTPDGSWTNFSKEPTLDWPEEKKKSAGGTLTEHLPPVKGRKKIQPPEQTG